MKPINEAKTDHVIAEADAIAIIWVYNHETFLRRCLDGAVNQEINISYKVVIHDDCSTDGSVSIINEYAEKYPHLIIPFIEKENQYSKGIPFHIALLHSIKCRYIAFCEGDDYWCDPHKIQKQYDHMEANPGCSMCVHNTLVHDLSLQTEDRTFFSIDNCVSLSALEVFDSWPAHYSSYFLRHEIDYQPEWSIGYWFGDYVILTMAYAYGRIDVLPDVMSVYNFNNPNGMTIGVNSEGEAKRIEATRGRAVYLRKYLSHVTVDNATETIINTRIKAIDEATATDELIYDLSLSLSNETVSSTSPGWLVDRMNDPLIRDECMCPAQATENNGSAYRVMLLFKYIQSYIDKMGTENTDDIEGVEFLDMLVKSYGYKDKTPELLNRIQFSPYNKTGWGEQNEEGDNTGINNPVDIRIRYLAFNYDYCYLKGRIEKARAYGGHNGILVLGSSYSLVGFDDKIYPDSFNCSMHSQDLYYDYLCAREVLDNVNSGTYKKCFIISGYYVGYTDLSLSNTERIERISRVYYPIFGDAHHWDEPHESDRWRFADINATLDEKEQCEKIAIETSKELPYFSPIRKRGPYYAGEPNEPKWSDLSDEKRMEYAERRAGIGTKGHASVLKYKDSFEDNKNTFIDLISYLIGKGVRPIFIIPPHTKEYTSLIPQELKDSVIELLNSTEEEVDYVDFNQSEMFETADFIDADHLSETGSRKFMELLYQLFGEEND